MSFRIFLRAVLLGMAMMTATMTPVFADEHRGANSGCGNYCPTEDHDHQGNGHAPQDGTKGRADSKNPPGQAPDGGDSNAGYECDRQTGVGDGNPAHTGCTATPTTPAPTAPVPSDRSTPTPIVQPPHATSTPVAPHATATSSPGVHPQRGGQPSVLPIPTAGQLPVTGVNLGRLALFAIIFILAGTAMVIAWERRS